MLRINFLPKEKSGRWFIIIPFGCLRKYTRLLKRMGLKVSNVGEGPSIAAPESKGHYVLVQGVKNEAKFLRIITNWGVHLTNEN